MAFVSFSNCSRVSWLTQPEVAAVWALLEAVFAPAACGVVADSQAPFKVMTGAVSGTVLSGGGALAFGLVASGAGAGVAPGWEGGAVAVEVAGEGGFWLAACGVVADVGVELGCWA